MEFLVFCLTLVVCLSNQLLEAARLPTAGLLNEMPSQCTDTGRSFCRYKHEKYPQKTIDELITNKYRLTLAPPHEDAFDRSDLDVSSDICKKETYFGPIYEIIDKDDNVRVVVQSDKLFKQQLTIEYCNSTKPEETYDTEIKSTDIVNNNLECYEKTINYKFLVLTTDGKDVEAVKSKEPIPVCCSCRVK